MCDLIDGIIIDLVENNKYSRPLKSMIPQSITIHETGNLNEGANAQAHSNYLKHVSQYVGYHFVVDDKEIIQCIPLNEMTYHAGDGGKGRGNTTSIAIEICINNDGNFEKAKENCKKLVQMIMKKTGIKEIYPHQHWSGKHCPNNILNNGWDNFLNYLHIGYGQNEELEQIIKERDYWRQKFKDVFDFCDETINFGGN